VIISIRKTRTAPPRDQPKTGLAIGQLRWDDDEARPAWLHPEHPEFEARNELVGTDRRWVAEGGLVESPCIELEAVVQPPGVVGRIDRPHLNLVPITHDQILDVDPYLRLGHLSEVDLEAGGEGDLLDHLGLVRLRFGGADTGRGRSDEEHAECYTAQVR